ncbi:MAG: hypothetical protein IPM54_39570 [Polyangiaceae bacterium]|nr:hypothetical protein [Polyangiaceae bacterium]
MHIRKLFGGTIFAYILVASLVPVQASNPVPDSACHIECEKVYEQEAGVCGRIAAEKESQKCANDANAHYRKCSDECDQLLTKCTDRCYEDYNDKVKLCNKIPDKVKQAKCQHVAAEQLGDCIRKCRRKKRSGD